MKVSVALHVPSVLLIEILLKLLQATPLVLRIPETAPISLLKPSLELTNC